MVKREYLFSHRRAFEAFSKEMEKATCDPKGGDTLAKRENNVISNSNLQTWRRAFWLCSVRKAEALALKMQLTPGRRPVPQAQACGLQAHVPAEIQVTPEVRACCCCCSTFAHACKFIGHL